VAPSRIIDILSRLQDAKLFSTVDLKEFFQLKLHPNSMKYTAFVTLDGLLYEFIDVQADIDAHYECKESNCLYR
jgi:hypothetical protein